MNINQQQPEGRFEQPKSEFKSSFKSWIRMVAFILVTVFLPEQVAQAVEYDWRVIWNKPAVGTIAPGYLKDLKNIDTALAIRDILKDIANKPINAIKVSSNLTINLDKPLKMSNQKIDEITEWLKGKPCGSKALYDYLNYSGVKAAEGDIAIMALTVDILNDVVKPEGKPEVIKNSLYALAQAAKFFGADLYPVKVRADTEISKLAPFIAQLKLEHYILVTRVTEDKVYYTDEHREEFLPKDTFLAKFSGYALTNILLSDLKILDPSESKRILGAGKQKYSFLDSVWNNSKTTVTPVKDENNALVGHEVKMNYGISKSKQIQQQDFYELSGVKRVQITRNPNSTKGASSNAPSYTSTVKLLLPDNKNTVTLNMVSNNGTKRVGDYNVGSMSLPLGHNAITVTQNKKGKPVYVSGVEMHPNSGPGGINKASPDVVFVDVKGRLAIAFSGNVNSSAKGANLILKRGKEAFRFLGFDDMRAVHVGVDFKNGKPVDSNVILVNGARRIAAPLMNTFGKIVLDKGGSQAGKARGNVQFMGWEVGRETALPLVYKQVFDQEFKVTKNWAVGWNKVYAGYGGKIKGIENKYLFSLEATASSISTGSLNKNQPVALWQTNPKNKQLTIKANNDYEFFGSFNPGLHKNETAQYGMGKDGSFKLTKLTNPDNKVLIAWDAKRDVYTYTALANGYDERIGSGFL
ncbi:MAG: cysteine peptidase family C39 domain-containing protein, partial [Candidatus Omnitrophica bacterium]|nr:cysteine peptidase family C39 domain-containing protein [Candidatus Omnitrophota bacterium]